MIKYRITKYNPIFRNEKGCYLLKDWTSISDIGKYYNNIQFTLEEYLKTEQEYINFYYKILKKFKINHIKIYSLEKYLTPDEAMQRMQKYNITFSEQEKNRYTNLKNKSMIPIDNFDMIFKFAMRELIWCKIATPNKKIIIEFGYDYYTYLSLKNLIIGENLIKQTASKGIFIEPFI
ncbi:MAG: hypothetical protein HDT22_09160 [Ruminococcus sp.]|nr:hypothetical protein [Ruminococcus sp.]